jgi:hypothetical protein
VPAVILQFRPNPKGKIEGAIGHARIKVACGYFWSKASFMPTSQYP